MPFKPVDTAIRVILGPAIDDTDFKTREEAIAFNQAGMEVDIILEKHDGTIVTTAVTPTAAGVYDWLHTDQGYYSLELPASGGGTFNNTEEGMITAVAYCTGVLPFRSVSYDVVPALVYASLVKGTDALQVDAIQISGDAAAANNAELAFDGTGYGFTGCTMPTVTTLSGHTAQTGDNFARIGATGSALTSLAQASVCTEARLAELAAANMPADIDTLLTRITAAVALASICTEARLAELDGANLPTDIANIKAETALIVADTNELQTDWKNGGRLDLILDIIAQDTTTDIPGTITTMQGNVTDILADTNELELDWKNGGRLDLLLDACALEATVAALNNISNANVKTQCDNALTDIKLDHLIAVADGDDPVNGSIIAMLAASDGDWSGFAIADDSLEAIRDRGDAAWTTGAGGTVPSLLQNTTIATLASQTSFTLTAGSVDDNAYYGAIIVITDAVSGVQKAVGRISNYTGATKTITLQEDPGIFTMAVGDTVDVIATDKLFIGYTDARAGYLDELAAANMPSDLDNTYASALGNFMILSSGVHGLAALKTLIDTMQGNVIDILGDTNELQTDWTDGGRLDLLLDRVLAATEIRQTSVNDIAATTTKFDTNLTEANDDFWNRGAILFTSGNNAGQMRRIKSYDGTAKEITVQTPLNAAPANADTFLIVASRAFLTVDIEDIVDLVWDELEAGHTVAGSFGEEVTKQGKKLDRNLILDL